MTVLQILHALEAEKKQHAAAIRRLEKTIAEVKAAAQKEKGEECRDCKPKAA